MLDGVTHVKAPCVWCWRTPLNDICSGVNEHSQVAARAVLWSLTNPADGATAELGGDGMPSVDVEGL